MLIVKVTWPWTTLRLKKHYLLQVTSQVTSMLSPTVFPGLILRFLFVTWFWNPFGPRRRVCTWTSESRVLHFSHVHFVDFVVISLVSTQHSFVSIPDPSLLKICANVVHRIFVSQPSNIMVTSFTCDHMRSHASWSRFDPFAACFFASQCRTGPCRSCASSQLDSGRVNSARLWKGVLLETDTYTIDSKTFQKNSKDQIGM